MAYKNRKPGHTKTPRPFFSTDDPNAVIPEGDKIWGASNKGRTKSAPWLEYG